MTLVRRSIPPTSWRPWRLGGWLAAVAIFAASLFAGSVRAADDRRPGPTASSCSDACDKKASDCVDACEDKFKDDKPRVQCKMVCIGDREKCEKECK